MFELVSKYMPSGDQPKAIKELVDGINNDHENKRYLPGYPLSSNMTASTDITM